MLSTYVKLSSLLGSFKKNWRLCCRHPAPGHSALIWTQFPYPVRWRGEEPVARHWESRHPPVKVTVQGVVDMVQSELAKACTPEGIDTTAAVLKD